MPSVAMDYNDQNKNESLQDSIEKEDIEVVLKTIIRNKIK